MSKNKVVILATEGLTTDLLYQGIKDDNEVATLIIENRVSALHKIKNRLKRIGFFKTMGQILFLTLVKPFISAKPGRIDEIISKTKLNASPAPHDMIKRVGNIHEQSVIESIKKHQPDLIIINGTRILKKDLLAVINCPVLNIHVGITPKYRGVHGGYWALRNNDPALFGVTLHKVDTGIDTGQIIAQKSLEVSAADNFNTYPILQYAEGILLLKQYLNGEELKNEILTKDSALWYHPTIWQYLFGKVK